MRYVRLGKTDLDVSAIAFGTWAFGGEWGSFDEDEAKDAIRHALDLGVTSRRAAQFDGTVLAADIVLSEQDREEIDGILSSAVPVTGPTPEGT